MVLEQLESAIRFMPMSNKGVARASRRSIEDLAIFGNPAAFVEPKHVGEPNVGNIDVFLRRAGGALKTHRLTNDGPLVKELEERVGALADVEYAIAVCNATVGLQLVVRALGLKGEVIVPSFTFVGTAHALEWIGITPRFCEVDPKSHTLNPRAVESAITSSTTGILPVHIWGRPCEIDNLSEIAHSHQLSLVFDAAQALGSSYRGTPIGGFGDAEVFSLHATKVVNSAEGGVITTRSSELAERLRRMRNFGFFGYDAVDGIGTNGKMNEISAALGLTSLDSFQEFVAVNRRNHEQYVEELRELPGVRLSQFGEGEQHNFNYVVLEIDSQRTHLSRDLLMEVLHKENILARRYFYPGCHRVLPYATAGQRLPVTEALCDRVLVLPTGTSTSSEDISGISSIVRLAVTHGKAIVDAFGSR